ncbi:MAG: penicillin acylase family protein [Pyrinomonadaceae bacterium]
MGTPDVLNGTNFEDEIAAEKIIRKRSLERIGFYEEHLAASNNWVVSGKRTADGNAILANDPHLQATAPGIWYLVHLSTPTMRVSGVTFPGVPGVVLGHNESIAWGATNVGPDVQDVYIEEFNDKGEYKTPEGWKKARVRKEEIRFRPNPLFPKLEAEAIEVLETRNGVVFTESDGKKLSLNWTARKPENQEFEAFFSLNRARNWDDFNSSLKAYGGASQNFIYADTKGNIGWHIAGKIPVRRKGEGDVPYNGATNDGDWIGWIPYDELPALFNPESGFIVTANQRIAGTSYKHQQIIRQFAAPWRARRIYDLLSANDKVTMDFNGEVQHDSFNIPLSSFAKEIVKRKAASGETISILGSWDGKMTADSVGATIADQINACVGTEIANVNKPASAWHIRQVILPWAIPNDDKLWLPEKYTTWDALLKACDSKAVSDLAKTARLGGTDRSNWKWGSFRVANFNHPLVVAPLIGGTVQGEFFKC